MLMFEFLANISAKISAFSKASTTIVPSSLDSGGNECVEKIELFDFVKDQKDLIPARQANSLHLTEAIYSDFACWTVLLQSNLAFKKAEWLVSGRRLPCLVCLTFVNYCSFAFLIEPLFSILVRFV